MFPYVKPSRNPSPRPPGPRFAEPLFRENWYQRGALGPSVVSWGLLGIFWGSPGVCWGAPGSLLGSPGISWELLGVSWGPLGVSCESPKVPGVSWGFSPGRFPRNLAQSSYPSRPYKTPPGCTARDSLRASLHLTLESIPCPGGSQRNWFDLQSSPWRASPLH